MRASRGFLPAKRGLVGALAVSISVLNFATAGEPTFSAEAGSHATTGDDFTFIEATSPVASREPASSAPGLQNASAGLVINTTFDSSVTNDPNASAIEAVINNAVAVYQSKFTDQITVSILFRYSNTLPNGSSFPANIVSYSNWCYYNLSWDTYISALRSDARSSNDNTANATLPAGAMTVYLRPTSANGRAVGLQTPPCMTATSEIATGAPYDGIVTLNVSAGIGFTRPVAAGKYDATRFIEHEIDEVLGSGSALGTNNSNFRPADLFSWSAAGVRNNSYTGTRYFSINGGKTNIIGFNQVGGFDAGDWFSESCPQTHVYVQNAFGCRAQAADVTDGSPELTLLDVIGYDPVGAAPAAQLLNISTRGQVLDGDNVMIGGFIVSGTQPKRVLIRAIGPSLSAFGVPGVLSDPTVTLFDGSNPPQQIGQNEDWQSTQMGGVITSDQVAEINVTGKAPGDSHESAIIASLSPGNYTAIVKGKNSTTGVGLVEVYDLASGGSSTLGNISTRAQVLTGDSVMIGGFIVAGTQPKKVLIRAIGPSLSAFGVPGLLADPTVTLFDGSNPPQQIGQNDDWQTTQMGGVITSDQVASVTATGKAPGDSHESAMIATLPPGNYTAIVKGKNSTTGIGLIEVYEIP